MIDGVNIKPVWLHPAFITWSNKSPPLLCCPSEKKLFLALACYFDLILFICLWILTWWKASIKWNKFNLFKMVVSRTTALLFLIVPQIFWLSRTIGQVLNSNANCKNRMSRTDTAAALSMDGNIHWTLICRIVYIFFLLCILNMLQYQTSTARTSPNT